MSYFGFSEDVELEIETFLEERALILSLKKGTPHRRDLEKHYKRWFQQFRWYCSYRNCDFKAVCNYYGLKGL